MWTVGIIFKDFGVNSTRIITVLLLFLSSDGLWVIFAKNTRFFDKDTYGRELVFTQATRSRIEG